MTMCSIIVGRSNLGHLGQNYTKLNDINPEILYY